MRSETGFALDVAQAGQLLVLRGRLDVRVTADVRLALAAAVSDGSGELVVDVAALEGVDATVWACSWALTAVPAVSGARWCCAMCRRRWRACCS